MLTADADGNFEVGELPPGTYTVSVHAPGFARFGSESVELTSGAVRDFGELRLQRGGTITVQLVRDPGFEDTELHMRAEVAGAARHNYSLPVREDQARSEALLEGEYILRLYGGGSGTAPVASRCVRAHVRAGEETRVELRVEGGAPVSIEFAPADAERIELQVLDGAGAILWEDTRVGRQAQLVLPPAAAVVVATDSRGRSARTAVATRPTGSDSTWVIELR
jgi:hypothetical protein